MTYRIICTMTDEIVADLADGDLAVKMADRLAQKSNYQEQFAVYELVLRHETAKPMNAHTGDDDDA